MFEEQIQATPLPASDTMLATQRDAWREALTRAVPEVSSRAAALERSDAAWGLLSGIFGSSPFLSASAIRDPGFVCEIFDAGPDAAVERSLATARAAALEGDSPERLMQHLRSTKREVALAVAMADLAGSWPLERVTGVLSDLADMALDLTLRHLLRELARQGRIEATDADDPVGESGVFILGMGKLGAGELNYSSDIDLILLYDTDRVRTRQPDRINQHFVRLARSLIHILQERTVDGYVFRTDLRLRPDPASTPLAISTPAAETYYESMGQNWERAAMIKARVAAGDRTAGEAFLQHLTPFVWRRSLDFEAIRDIHSIKRQINAFRGGGSIAVAGHNLKLGRGGIREIEFYAQTQQLIWGGRDASLRERGTRAALDALVRARLVTAQSSAELQEAYVFHRRLEHRLQMVADQQTHSLPAEQELAHIGRFFGYADKADFVREVRDRLERVEHHYAHLFEDESPLGGGGSLVFTGTEDDPDTIGTLSGMGFREPARIAAMVRSWHHGRVRPTRSVRARELLTELIPALLEALAKTPDPDLAVRRFDAFLTALPAGVQLFSLFQANRGLLELTAEILGCASHLAEHLTRNPIVLDAVLTPSFFAPPAAREQMQADLEAALEQAGDFEDVLRITRFWANDRKFQIGVQVLRAILQPVDAAHALSDVADTVVAGIQPAVEREFIDRHGSFPDGGLAVLAFGKLGSRELTFASDLDLVMIYDAPRPDDLSDGPKPLAAGTYYVRLTQRLVTAITTLTGEGKLFEVDLRLRPSGNDGPVAVSLGGFAEYYRGSAWTWEYMALTRARTISGPPRLRDRIEQVCRDVLVLPRDPDRLAIDVAEMRAKMAKNQGAVSPWSIKHRRGGMIDAEFIAQYMVLRHAHAHPEVVTGDAAEAFGRLATAGLLESESAAALTAAIEQWRCLQLVLRLTEAGDFDEATAPIALKTLLARVCGCVDFEAIKARMSETADRTLRLFDALVAEPANRAASKE